MAQSNPSKPLKDGSETGIIKLKVELGGGLETLFQNSKSIEVTLTEPFHLQHLISILSTQVNPISSMSLFCSPGPDYDIKPGILPLVNDEDWELLEPSGMKAILKDGDQVMFISTLHGG